MKNKWYQGKIVSGKKIAQKLGFPTLNLDNPKVLSDQKEGVYAAKIKIKRKVYDGLLYYGPRLILKEKENIAEIFVFDFNKQIYGETVYFQLVDYIREVKIFPDFAAFKKQLTLDCQKAKERLKYKIEPM